MSNCVATGLNLAIRGLRPEHTDSGGRRTTRLVAVLTAPPSEIVRCAASFPLSCEMRGAAVEQHGR